jgi:hypothetical protein
MGNIFSYADDTAIVFTAKTWDKLKSRTEAELARIATWLNIHLLSLNVKKTNFICFSKYDSGQPPPDYRLRIHQCGTNSVVPCPCPYIQKATSTRYLGVMLDQRLS